MKHTTKVRLFCRSCSIWRFQPAASDPDRIPGARSPPRPVAGRRGASFGQPAAAVSEERDRSLHSGELFAKKREHDHLCGRDGRYLHNGHESEENRLLVECGRPRSSTSTEHSVLSPLLPDGPRYLPHGPFGKPEKICENSSIRCG